MASLFFAFFAVAASLLAVSVETQEAPPPALNFGPTANLPPNALAALVAGVAANPAGWTQVRAIAAATGGALHLRKNALIVCSPAQQRALAVAAATVGFRMSVESGGGLCGSGSGAESANDTLTGIAPFLDAGGKIHTLLLGAFMCTASVCVRCEVSSCRSQTTVHNNHGIASQCNQHYL